jgi:hypothetical protein
MINIKVLFMNAKKMKTIKRLIHANLVGEEIGIGNSELFIGRTFCSGDEIKDYLFEYHDGDSEKTEDCIKWLVNTAFEGLKTESAALAILRCDNSEIWRGFRGNEIGTKKTNLLH